MISDIFVVNRFIVLAVDFLQGHQFQFDASFLRGVPHLSWELEVEARALAQAEWDRDGFADISIKPGDTESFELMKRVRNEIESWKTEVPVSFEARDLEEACSLLLVKHEASACHSWGHSSSLPAIELGNRILLF